MEGVLQLAHVVVQHVLVRHVGLAFVIFIHLLLQIFFLLIVVVSTVVFASVRRIALVFFGFSLGLSLSLVANGVGFHLGVLGIGAIFVDIKVLRFAVAECSGHDSTAAAYKRFREERGKRK